MTSSLPTYERVLLGGGVVSKGRGLSMCAPNTIDMPIISQNFILKDTQNHTDEITAP